MSAIASVGASASGWPGSAGLHPASTGDAERDLREKKSAIRGVGIGAAVLAILAALGMSGVVALNATVISDGLGWCLLGISVVVFSWLIFFGNWSPVERQRCAAILVPVSYTHLRAHETGRNLVCRL